MCPVFRDGSCPSFTSSVPLTPIEISFWWHHSKRTGCNRVYVNLSAAFGNWKRIWCVRNRRLLLGHVTWTDSRTPSIANRTIYACDTGELPGCVILTAYNSTTSSNSSFTFANFPIYSPCGPPIDQYPASSAVPFVLFYRISIKTKQIIVDMSIGFIFLNSWMECFLVG